MIAPAAMQQMSINYTRSNEKEADRIGFNNLVKAAPIPSLAPVIIAVFCFFL